MYVYVNMLEIEKLVLSYNKQHQISCATGSSIVTISHCYQMDRITQITSSSKQPLLQKYDIYSRSVNCLKLDRIYPDM